MKNLQDFKDEIAVERGYRNYDEIYVMSEDDLIANDVISEAAKRYANYSRNQGFDQGVEAAAALLIYEFGIDQTDAENMLVDVKESFKP